MLAWFIGWGKTTTWWVPSWGGDTQGHGGGGDTNRHGWVEASWVARSITGAKLGYRESFLGAVVHHGCHHRVLSAITGAVVHHGYCGPSWLPN